MEHSFWHECWENNQIGFHCSDVNPLLRRFWPELSLDTGSRILVPLCGKSLDLLWLREQGYRVVGVELSALAVGQFFDSAGLHPKTEQVGDLKRWYCEGLEIFCGDFFALETEQLGPVQGVYDRAALVALPPAMRRDYVGHLAQLLSSGSRGLLITLDYPQQRVEGPPFAVGEAEVQALYQPRLALKLRHQFSTDTVPPKFRNAGVEQMQERVYLITTD